MASKYFKAFNLFKGKVSPTIKSIKPTTKTMSKSVKDTKLKQTVKNIDLVNKLKKQKAEGIASARKASRDLQSGAETKKFTKIGNEFFGRRSPADDIDLKNPTVAKTKKFKTGKQLEAEKKARNKKMGGGMMGRRFGMKSGTPFKKKTNVEKIKETFGVKKKDNKQRMQAKDGSKKKFPDLTGDGKVTFADILKGRGVINGKKKGKK